MLQRIALYLLLPLSGIAASAVVQAVADPASSPITVVRRGPTISSVVPSTGEGGTELIITGSGFGADQGESEVWLRATKIGVRSWSDTRIVALPPAGPLSGFVRVLRDRALSNPVPLPGTPPVPWRDVQDRAPGSNMIRLRGRVDSSARRTAGEVMLTPGTLNLLVGQRYTLRPVDSRGQLVTGLTWASSDPSVVKLSAGDPPVLTALAPGKVTITAGTGMAVVSVAGNMAGPGTATWPNPDNGFGLCRKAARATVAQVQERITSSNWRDRAAAVNDTLDLLRCGAPSAGEADSLRYGLIELLAKEENLRRARAKTEVLPRTMTKEEAAEAEEEYEYFDSLVGAVAFLNDERAIPALLLVPAAGGAACPGVSQFGTKALDAVLEQANGPDSKLAAGALFVVLEMLEFRTVTDPVSLLRIKTVLRSALASPDPSRRQIAVWAIEFLEDREEFVPALKEIAAHDPAKLSGQPLSDGTIGDHYFVRRTAERVLDRIAQH
jgi:hypothetical protein